MKAKLKIAKSKMESVLSSFPKQLESGIPNFNAINHYNHCKDAVEQRLADVEGRTYEAIDGTPANRTDQLVLSISSTYR